jgi:serine-type D-Ala-D-Ala carboxypeptidase
VNPNLATDNSQLLPAWENQDQVFAAAFSVLESAIAAHAFPAASIAVTHAGKLIALKSFGHFVYESDAGSGAPLLAGFARSGGVDVNVATLFDLGSLTKVVVATTMAMILYERGLLELDAPIIGTIPEFLIDSCGEPDARRRDVTFRMILAHSSGLPAYEKLFLQARTRDELLRAAFTMPLSADPGFRAEYSDIGFIILGAALERIAQEPLDIFGQREIFGPLGMLHTTFNPPAALRSQIPPTADERDAHVGTAALGCPVERSSAARSTFRNRIIQGEVQDENAFVLGGVAPHAGLFSTAEDLARFAHAILRCGARTPAREAALPNENCHFEQAGADATASRETLRFSEVISKPFLRPETVVLFTRRESTPTGTSRALGWDTPSAPSQSGKYFGPNSFGHLGYTGTSLWIDPDRQLSITLLTNRTWPDCTNQAIKQVRPKFHNAVCDAWIELRQFM